MYNLSHPFSVSIRLQLPRTALSSFGATSQSVLASKVHVKRWFQKTKSYQGNLWCEKLVFIKVSWLIQFLMLFCSTDSIVNYHHRPWAQRETQNVCDLWRSSGPPPCSSRAKEEEGGKRKEKLLKKRRCYIPVNVLTGVYECVGSGRRERRSVATAPGGIWAGMLLLSGLAVCTLDL